MKVYVYKGILGYLHLTPDKKIVDELLGTLDLPIEPIKKTIKKEVVIYDEVEE